MSVPASPSGSRASMEPLRVSTADAASIPNARKKCGGRSPKMKGYRFENECRLLAISYGLQSRRVPLSGAGEEKGDLCITASWGQVFRCELKRRACLPEWIVKALGDHDLMVMREDNGKALAVLPFEKLLELLQ